MKQGINVLIVADDCDAIANLATHVVTMFDANITVVDSIAEGSELSSRDAYDLILAASVLSDGHGLELARSDGPPVIMIDDSAGSDPAVASIRAGASDVVGVGIAADQFAGIVSRHVESFRARRHLSNRNRRLRNVSRRLIRDRRELRERVDLICRDLVQAYRRLAEKAVKTPGFGEVDYSSSESMSDS